MEEKEKAPQITVRVEEQPIEDLEVGQPVYIIQLKNYLKKSLKPPFWTVELKRRPLLRKES